MTTMGFVSTRTALVAVVLSLGILAGCGEDNTEATTADAGSRSATETTETTAPHDGVAGPTTDDDPPPSGVTPGPDPDRLTGRYTVEIVATFPHDPTAYTQGLEWHEGTLIESTGGYGQSSRRIIDITSGTVLHRENLDPGHFGEGLTVVDDEVWQLTWREGVLLRADVENLSLRQTAEYTGEGWGLCFDGDRLIRSDGSSRLTFHDRHDFTPLDSVVVTAEGREVNRLNELECHAGQVLANLYGQDLIVVIDPATGIIEATIDAAALRPPDAPADDLDYVLNGIARNPDTGHYYLTGKYWPVLHEVIIVPH